MTRTAGSLSKATAEKIILLEKEVIIPLILQIFLQPLNSRVPFKLKILHENRKRYSVNARDRFDEFFSITKHGRNAVTGECWPTKITMSLHQFLMAKDLLADHGYSKNDYHINIEILNKPLLEKEIAGELVRIEMGLN
jgi:hypothetical protein